MAHGRFFNFQIWPSIGGWTLSDNFPAMAKDPISRRNFAANCVGLIKDYGFDGIDIGAYNILLRLLLCAHPFYLTVYFNASSTYQIGNILVTLSTVEHLMTL